MQNILKVPMAKDIHWSDVDELIEELYQIDESKLTEEGYNYPHEWLQNQIAEDSGAIDDLIRKLLPAIQVGTSPLTQKTYKGFGFVEGVEGGESWTSMILQVDADLAIEKTGDVPDEEEEDEDE